MFKFGRKDKLKSDEKKERKGSKKEKKSKESTPPTDDADGERYTQYPPPVAPKPKSSSGFHLGLKNGRQGSGKGILKVRSFVKSKPDPRPPPSNLDDPQILLENTRMNEEFGWRVPGEADRSSSNLRKRESIHSITMNIAPPSDPPPVSAAGKVYHVDLELPKLTPYPTSRTRDLTVYRQPKGDFGFNLRLAPYRDSSGMVRSVVHAEPGSSGSKSGVVTGDRIVEINSVNVEHSSREEVIGFIQKSGNSVLLKVQQVPEVSELNSRTAGGRQKTVENDESHVSLTNGHTGGDNMYWLVHKGGYSSCQLIQPASADGSTCKVQLEMGAHVLEVDENDLEKVNPAGLDRCEDLSSLLYLNESSILHVLRQRFGSSLIQTVAGPSLLVVNPNRTLNLYSRKVMEMVRACAASELPPHVYSKAQSVYQAMVSTGRDQSIVMTGRAGSGKTTTMGHILSYYSHMYGGVHSVSLDEKLSAACTVVESLGNCRTRHNDNSTRCSQLVTVNFDRHGLVTSSSFQVLMLERSRVTKLKHGESSFHIFHYILYGSSLSTRQSLQISSSHNSIYADERVDKEAAAAGWAKLDQALRVLAIGSSEGKLIQQVVAAIIHIQNSGVTYGANNKAYFADPAGAQTASRLLGVSMEQLSKAIFSSPSVSTSRQSADEDISAGREALEGFVTGLYCELINTVVNLINRSLVGTGRSHTSITLVDTPGFRSSSNQLATFDDLCNNYVNERIQLLFYEKVFTEKQERYMQENIDVELDDAIKSPEGMVKLMDKCSSQQLMQLGGSSSRVDLSALGRDEEADMGLLWILDQLAMTPGSSSRQFVDKLHHAHGSKVHQFEKLLTIDPKEPTVMTLKHLHTTSPVTYDTSGWMKDCRNHPSSEQAVSLLNSSQKSEMTDMFNSMTGSMISSFTSTGSRGEGTLRRGNSLRRNIANQAGIKRRSQAILVKYQTDSIIESLAKTGVHFISHLLANDTAAPSAGKDKTTTSGVLNVPFVRVQMRSLQLLEAVRFYRQGYPEYTPFDEFISKYSLLTGQVSAQSVALVDQKSVVEGILSNTEVDASHYRIGLSQVFLRPTALTHLDRQRELRRSFYAVAIQKHVRRYLAQKAIVKLKLKHEAMKCIQKNIRIDFKLRHWQWWRLYTKIKPLVNVHQTEDDLKFKENELKELKKLLEKTEAERITYKKECGRLEEESVRFQSELAQERQLSRQAVELIEQETSSRLAAESQLAQAQRKEQLSQQKLAELEQENEDLRQVHQDYDDAISDEVDGVSVSRAKYEHMVKEHELQRRQMQAEYESEIEELKHAKHRIEFQLRTVASEGDEQTEQIHNLKKKVQKYANEAQDLKRQCEDTLARNTELEKRQRRFDNELHQQAGDIAGQKNMRDQLQKERDELLKQKYTLGQQLEDVVIERDNLLSKLRRLEHEMSELKCAGTGDSELLHLRTVKHELERRLADSEDDIGDLQQEMHELEMAKLKLQMENDKMKQRHQKEQEQLERELDELREGNARKVRNYENRITELDEELQAALQAKRDAERRLSDARDAVPVRDHEHEKELKTVIRRLRCLLSDAQGQLEKSKEQANQKLQIRTLESKLEDLQASLTATLKSKHSVEIELQECQQQMSNASRSRMEAEDKLTKLMRDKTDVENEKEDLDEEIHELLKRYQALLSQNSVTVMKSNDQAEQITSLTEARNRLQEELDTLSTKLAHLDSHCVPKERVAVLESKCLEMEQKLDYEKSLHIRYENLALKAKDNCEKLEDEVSRLTMKLVDEERRCRQIQSQLSRALESFEETSRKDIEQTQTILNMTQRLDISDAEIKHLQTELKSAQKRVEHLQSTIMQSTLADDEDSSVVTGRVDGEYDSDSDDSYS